MKGRTPQPFYPRGPARHSAAWRPRPGPPGLQDARPSRTLTPAALRSSGGPERPAGKEAGRLPANHVTPAALRDAAGGPALRPHARRRSPVRDRGRGDGRPVQLLLESCSLS